MTNRFFNPVDDMDVVDATAKITLLQIDPDTGNTLATCANVLSLRRATDDGITEANDGEVYKTSGRFHLKAVDCSFAPKKRDVIVEANGTKWNIDKARSETLNTRYVCDVTLLPK